MYDNNNIFAKIIRGDIPCKKVYEDESCLFFYDINPVAPIHILAIPKKPNIDFYDFISSNKTETVSNFFNKINQVIDKLEIKNDGYRLVSNSGINGGQEVPHFHIHILAGEKLKSKI